MPHAKAILPESSAPTVRQWTDRQHQAIATDGCSLLVSAAAGSGKTSVLAERCAHMVCDAAEPCGVDQLLVVTFTESAATEMRQRIQAALRDRMTGDRLTSDGPAGNARAHLARQLALVEHAHISTVHSFCARLLRQNFNIAGLDPHFQVIDGDEAALMRLEIARDLFDQHYEKDKTGEFHALIDAYGEGRDEALIQQVIHIHELLTSLIDPRGWLDAALLRVDEAASQPLDGSQLGRELLAAIDTALHRLEQRCAQATAAIRKIGGFPAYVNRLGEWSDILLGWMDAIARRGIDGLLAEVRNFAPGSAPPVKADTPNKELVQALLASVKDQMRCGPLSELVAFTEAEWRQGLKATRAPMAVLLGLVREFGVAYAKRKAENRGLDFADLERKALQVLRDGEAASLAPSAVARSLHLQYRHVLVDEYQDINELQEAILLLVSRECVASERKHKSNLFAVGDVKQSIFRFRLAEPRRFLDREERFRAKRNGVGQVIDLSENFRSRPALLAAINEVFKRLMTRDATDIEYHPNHQLRAAPGVSFAQAADTFPGAPIELHLLPSELASAGAEEDDDDAGIADLKRADYEAMLCARRILRITGRDGGKPMWVTDKQTRQARPADFGDIVILLRALRFKADLFADVLRKHGIPVHSEGGAGFFEAMEIRDVLSLLNVLDNQRQDIPLAAVLRSPIANLPGAETALARISLKYFDAQEPIPFHQAVTRYAAEQDDELAARLKDFLTNLSTWRGLAQKRPLAEVLWQIYSTTGYLAFCAGLDDGRQRVANLIDLHQRASKFGAFLKQGLWRFIRYLNTLRDEKDISRPSLGAENERVVRIMTIHRAKGQEFPIVLAADLGKQFNMSDARGSILIDRKAGLGLSVVDEPRRIRYPSLAWRMVKAEVHRQTLAEELRLLYVMMTRAKEHLILIGTAPASAADKWAGAWTGHQGPMAADQILCAKSPLDWLGPIHFAAGGAGSKVLELIAHSVDDVRTWPNPRAPRPAFTPRQKALAELRPLEPNPPMTQEARRIIAGFEERYAHEPFVHLRATSTATAGKTSPIPPALAASEERTGAGLLRQALELPAFLMDQRIASPADIGTATHLVLEHLDFSRVCDAADINEQIQAMLDRHLVSSVQAQAVDRKTLLWFVNTDLGKHLKANASGLRREIPFAVASAPEKFPDMPSSADPMDAVMIRGRIDLLAPKDGGYAVVDYKTDRVTEQNIRERADSYAAQVRTYRNAIENVAKKRVTGVYLVFLSARRIEERQ